MRFDVDQFEERAAICEFDGCMSRFDAETLAAREQGLARWQAVKIAKEARDAQRDGHSAGSGHFAPTVAREQRQDDLSIMQRASEEKDRPVSERQQAFGRPGVVLPSLRNERGGAV